MAGRIAVIGSNNVDLVTNLPRMPLPGETLAGTRFSTGFGGKGANQAVAAARLGSAVMMVTRVGDDGFGQDVLRNLEGHGIDLTHARVAKGTANGVASIFVDPSGENVIVIVAGANGTLTPADVEAAADDLTRCDLILLQLEVPLETVYHAIKLAARLGVPAILNPAPAAPGLDLAALQGLSWFCPNQTELAMLTGLPVATEDQIAAAAQSLLVHGIGNVVVTLGARGARLVTAGGVTAIPAIRVRPVDTTGAGDAFIGAFAHFLAAGAAPEQALAQAAGYAALSVTKPGAQGSYASAQEFAAFQATTVQS
ncbi:ribokinase [Paracoccus sp. MC1862]|uniref:ribokinase n=1 Tax=Paracoccus sp. MC1862 TaxID=2760307 RepID=UPI001603A826|nr:ribokinase [Paracoccus sp. MC1862]MBB1499402.1 ribokinase [Paracoccus sp. MC1862]QQO45360.1 ribokinase [Paracoccus sp. MC1862]